MSFAKIKKTSARLAITDYFYNIDYPVDIQEIIKFLRSKDLNTNKTTVYRIIEYLYNNNLLERLDFGEGKFRYEIKKGDHHHLICNKCGRIEDITDNFINDFENEILDKRGFQVKKHSLEFFGICKNCQS
jgi:Fur family ferric uptake transcriptional regulator